MATNPESSQTKAAVSRPFASGYLILDLDGVRCGYLNSVDGGAISGVVVEENNSASLFPNKHLAGVKYEDVVIAANLSMDGAFYDWIQNSFKRQFARHDGSIHTADYNLKEHSIDEYYNALINEVTFPKLDASSKDACAMTVKFSPEYTRHKKGSNTKLKVDVKPKQKVWHAANFRLSIDALECKRVSKVDALTVKMPVARDDIGVARESLHEPGKIDFPNLVVTLPEIDGDTWLAWHEDFVVKGNNGDEKERNGTLEYLAADQKTPLATLEFANLGIFRITRDKVEAGSEKARTITVEMYVEGITFTVKEVDG